MSVVPERLFLEWARAVIRLDGTIEKFAAANGRSVQFVSAVLTGKRRPPEWMLKVLGAERRVIYEIPDHPKSRACRYAAGSALLERDRNRQETP
jgi:hypothetical protein